MTDTEDRACRVLALAEDHIPSAVLGVYTALRDLEAHDGRLSLRIASTKAFDDAEIAWADVVILVRGASPAERRIAERASALGRKVATYLDDDLEEVPEGARSAYFFRSPVVRENIAAIVRSADAVLVCNERLGDELERRHGRPATVLRQPRPRRAAEEGDGPPPIDPTTRPVIGFLGSVDHTTFIEELLGPALRELRSEYGNEVDLVFCGASPAFAEELGARTFPFEADFDAWRRRALSLRISIGLAPLRESAFHSRKYWNKYLEYGSLQAAGIYSDVAPTNDVVRHGDTGLLCPNEPEAWLAALRRLLRHPDERRRIARNAWHDVETRFSPDALRPSWSAALGQLLDHRAPEIAPVDVRLPSGALRFGLDRLAVYGPWRFTERLVGRLTGRLRPG